MATFGKRLIFLWILTLVTARPASESSGGSSSNHNLVWKNEGKISLDKQLQSNLERGDFFYLFTGDTQHFHPCTYDNAACLAQTPECPSKLTNECIEKQSEWSNKHQLLSMRSLLKRLESATGQLPKALLINGDLAEMGTPKELDTFKTKWENFHKDIPVYPGLGNHDYSNNIDQCEKNYCVHRMLSYFTDYVKNTLKREVDMSNETAQISGSLSYSWDECTSEKVCIHFTQQNYYPTYTRQIKTNVTTWNITPSLDWLSNDLKGKSGQAIILNLHDFDVGFRENDKQQLKTILSKSQASVVAIFFAHVHEKVGLRKPPWCLDGQSNPVWTIYSGSVPGSNYVLAHLSPANKSLKALYKVHVNNETTSTIELESLDASCTNSGTRKDLSYFVLDLALIVSLKWLFLG